NIADMSTRGEIAGGEITREEQDRYALESHRRAVAAMRDGRFEGELVPVTIPQRRDDPVTITRDEHPRYREDNGEITLDTDFEQLGRLRPAFREGGSVTAGNSSG